MGKYGVCVICNQYGLVHRHHLDYEKDITILVCPKHHKRLHRIKNELDCIKADETTKTKREGLNYAPIPQKIVNAVLLTCKKPLYTTFSYDLLSWEYALRSEVVIELKLKHLWHQIKNDMHIYLPNDPRYYCTYCLRALHRSRIGGITGFIYIDSRDWQEWSHILEVAMLTNTVLQKTKIPENEWVAVNYVKSLCSECAHKRKSPIQKGNDQAKTERLAKFKVGSSWN